MGKQRRVVASKVEPWYRKLTITSLAHYQLSYAAANLLWK